MLDTLVAVAETAAAAATAATAPAAAAGMPGAIPASPAPELVPPRVMMGGVGKRGAVCPMVLLWLAMATAGAASVIASSSPGIESERGEGGTTKLLSIRIMTMH